MGLSAEDIFDELFKLAPEKVKAVKEVREIRARPVPPVTAGRNWALGHTCCGL